MNFSNPIAGTSAGAGSHEEIEEKTVEEETVIEETHEIEEKEAEEHTVVKGEQVTEAEKHICSL